MITVEPEELQPMVLWVLVALGIAVVATAELVLLNQLRPLFLAHNRLRGRLFERGRRAATGQLYLRLRRALSGLPTSGGRTLKHHAARNILHWTSVAEEADLSPDGPAAGPADIGRAEALPSAHTLDSPARAAEAWGTEPSRVATAPLPTPEGEGIVYVNASGRMTFANAAARALLHWNSGERFLSDVLAGGTQELAALLKAVARHELIERQVTLLTESLPTRVEMSALALRDRDGNLWGVALFVRRALGARQPSTDESR